VRRGEHDGHLVGCGHCDQMPLNRCIHCGGSGELYLDCEGGCPACPVCSEECEGCEDCETCEDCGDVVNDCECEPDESGEEIESGVSK